MKPIRLTAKRMSLLCFLEQGSGGSRRREQVSAYEDQLTPLHESGLIVAYTMRIIGTSGIPIDTPEVSITAIGRLAVQAYNLGRRRGR